MSDFGRYLVYFYLLFKIILSLDFSQIIEFSTENYRLFAPTFSTNIMPKISIGYAVNDSVLSTFDLALIFGFVLEFVTEQSH